MKKLALLTHFRLSALVMAVVSMLFGSCAVEDGDYFTTVDQLGGLLPQYGMGEYRPCVLMMPNGDSYELPLQDIRLNFGVDSVTHVVTGDAIITASFRHGILLPPSTSWQLVLDVPTFEASLGVPGKEQLIRQSSIYNEAQHFGYTLLHNGGGVYARSIDGDKVDLYLDLLTYIATDNTHIPSGEYHLYGDIVFNIPVEATE